VSIIRPRGVRHTVGQHVWRVAHPDPARGRRIDVGRVVADAEVHHRTEVRQRRHQVRVHADAALRHRHADLIAVRRQELCAIRGISGQ